MMLIQHRPLLPAKRRTGTEGRNHAGRRRGESRLGSQDRDSWRLRLEGERARIGQFVLQDRKEGLVMWGHIPVGLTLPTGKY